MASPPAPLPARGGEPDGQWASEDGPIQPARTACPRGNGAREKGEKRVEDQESRERVARLDALLADLETLPDPRARTLATEAVRALLELYGEGLVRITEAVAALGGTDALRSLARDDLVSHLLLLHGLHPVAVEERVAQALEEVRPSLRKRGVSVAFLGIAEGRARVRVQGAQGGCQSCAATASLPERMIEEALTRFAPDLVGVDLIDQPPPSRLIPVALVARREKPHGNGKHAVDTSAFETGSAR